MQPIPHSAIGANMTLEESVLKAYIECAVWSSTDDNGTSLDTLEDSELSEETRHTMQFDVLDFLKLLKHQGIAWQDHMSAEQLGHDFWLTRNRHGAGFCDKGLGKLGETLTEYAHIYGTCDLYIGDDKKIYCA